MKNIILITIALLASCANLNTSVRTEYFLDKVGPFVVSNSQTNPYQLKKIKGGIEIEYALVAKNVSAQEQNVSLNNSTYKVNNEEGSLACYINNNKELGQMKIQSQKQFRVDCFQRLLSNNKNELLSKDSTVILNIVLNDLAQLSLRYSTVIEDFE